jgi:hypothetical protein
MRDPAMGEPRKRITRMRYDVGPMGFLSDQIRKEMQRAGYPAREFNLYRPPEEQDRMFARRVSNARRFQSSHQYYAASDIIHERWAWFDKRQPGVPDGTQFWDRLWDCVEVVGEKYNVEFSERLSWDPAHVQLENWREFKTVVGEAEPNQTQLDWYFQITLPAVWKQHLRGKLRAA